MREVPLTRTGFYLWGTICHTLLESEKCPVCGTPVKRENLRAHYEKVHPRRVGSLVQPKTGSSAKTTPIFRSHRRRNVLILSLVVLAIIGVSVVAVQFANANTLRIHWHPQLTITLNTNQSIQVPAQIGIDPNLWKDHTLDQYGTNGLSPLHTHDTSGRIHVESNTVRDFTLGEFLAVWGQPSNAVSVEGHPVVSITVDNQAHTITGDIVLKDGQQIIMATRT